MSFPFAAACPGELRMADLIRGTAHEVQWPADTPPACQQIGPAIGGEGKVGLVGVVMDRRADQRAELPRIKVVVEVSDMATHLAGLSLGNGHTPEDVGPEVVARHPGQGLDGEYALGGNPAPSAPVADNALADA